MEAQEFRKMFVVDPPVTSYKDGNTIHSDLTLKKQHRYNLRNQDIKEGDTIKEATASKYINQVVYLFFDELKPSEIKPFLNYHHENAVNKTELINFIKYDIWELFIPPLILSAQRESIIKEWIENIKTKDQSKGMKLKEIYSQNSLKLFTTDLVNCRSIKNTDNKNFLSVFNHEAVFSGIPVKWNGSNPELATLIFRLTGKDPIPSLVNLYFDPINKYDSNSKRIKNDKIKQLIKNRFD